MPGDSTFGQLSKILELYSPNVPPPLLGQFVNNAHSRALTANNWSTLRGVGAVAIPAPYSTGTITVTNGSTTVTGSGTAWTSADHALNQLVVAGFGPFWDIASVESPTSLTLATPWVGTTASAQAYTIQLIYIVLPTDFMHFTFFGDASQNWWQLSFEMLQETADQYDTRRSYSGTPVAVFETQVSPFTSTLGQTRYEIWPRPSGAKVYAYRYQRRPALMSAPTDRIVFPLRGDIIREGALADLSMWPGTAQDPNKFHDATGVAAKYHMDLYREGIAKAKVDDKEMRPEVGNYHNEFLKLFPLPGSEWWQTVSYPAFP